MSVSIPTPAALAQRFVSALAAQQFTASDGTTVTLDATAPATLESALAILSGLSDYEIYLYLRDQLLELMVTTATENGLLPQHAAIWGCPRLAATAAVGNFVVAASAPGSLPSGTLITVDGSVQWATTAACTIVTGGAATVPVVATTAGVAGNLPANSGATLVSPVAGVQTVVSDQDGIAGGAPIEAVESWRARIIASIREPGETGTAADYVKWATDGGAAFVSVVPIVNGAGAIAIFIMMAGGVVPTPAQVAVVQNLIDTKRPLCAKPVVYAGEIAVQDMSITLRPDSTTARTQVTSALQKFFLGAGLGATLYRDAIASTIASVAGYSNDLSIPAGDTTLQANQMAQLGTITWGAT